MFENWDKEGKVRKIVVILITTPFSLYSILAFLRPNNIAMKSLNIEFEVFLQCFGFTSAIPSMPSLESGERDFNVEFYERARLDFHSLWKFVEPS